MNPPSASPSGAEASVRSSDTTRKRLLQNAANSVSQCNHDETEMASLLAYPLNVKACLNGRTDERSMGYARLGFIRRLAREFRPHVCTVG